MIDIPDDPASYVEALALDYLRLAAREPKRIGRRDLKLTATATAEYEGRFLVELIQNAYDAHTATRNDGLIVVDFDPDDGQFGTLWVANAGFPFGVSNVAAISEIGNSDKRPDQGVGNKGVGFRAVLRICEWPEIYSSRMPGADDSFAGFRFGFAHPTDIDRLKAIVESEGNVVPKVSPYCVVVPMTNTPAGLDVFSRRGIATVIRLPLRSREAAAMVRQEVEWLTGSERPLLLFLDRIGRLEVTIRPGVPVAQTRAVRRLAMTPREVAIDQVDLDPGGSFILASRVVPASSVREAIGATVKAGLLDDEWLEWNEPVTVSMAVAVGGDGRTGVFYTYLPMDHAAAPGASHVNAPFITKMARRDLDPDVPVNALYIREAAGIAIEAGYWARSTLLDPAVVVDFTAWEVRYASQFDQAAAAVPQKESALVLPANGRAARWLLLTDSRHWAPDGTTVFGPDRVSELPGSRLIDGSLGSNRIERLEQIMRKRVGRSMTPDPEELAEWAEELAAAQRSNVGWEVWDQFYGDIARVFNRTAIHLIGRKILIDEDARLREGAGRSDRRGDRRAAAVFFPPLQLGQAESAEGEANAADIPSSLRDRLVYMNRHLTWFESLPSGGRRARPARGFLESSGLVQEFRTETLLDYTRDISARTRSDAVRSDLLLWSYRLVKAMRGDAPPALDRLGLRVPTRSGWVASSESVFGPEWADEGGANLSALISATSGSIPELARMPERFLLPPTSLPFPIADHGEAVDFLKRLGVQSGLRPVAGETSWPLIPGGQLTPTWIASRSEMSDVLASWWVGRLDADGYKTHRYEDYRITGQLWRWPAQESFSGLPLTAKRLYAVLVLNAVPALRDEQRYLSIGRPTGYARDPQQWPTPAQVFLEEELWLPMGHPNERHVYRYGRPAKTWHADDADEQPDFAPLLAGEFARRVRADNELRQQLLDLGLKLWADRDYAGDQIEFMGDLIDSDYPSEARAASFKKAYARAWQDAIAAGHQPFAGESPEVAKVVVTRSGRLEAVDLLRKDEAFDVYVQDTDESTVTRLIDELSWPYMRFERDGAAAVEILKRLAPDRVRPTSEVDLRVLVDSEVFRPSDEAELLTGGDRVWIRDLVLLVHEFQPRAADALVRTQASQRRVAEALDRVRVKRAETLQLMLGGAPVGNGVRPNRPLALRDDKYPTLVVVQEREWSWSMLAHGARGLSELVGQPALSSYLELVVTKIGQLSQTFARPDDEILAEALDVEVRQLLEARAEFQSSMASVLFRLAPVVCVYAGRDGALRFIDRDDLTTTEGIQREINALTNVSLPDDVIAVCSEPLTLAEVRDKLGIGYKQFNEALIALEPIYHPLLNEEGHLLAVEAWVRANRDHLLPRVTIKYALAFDQYGDLSGTLPSETFTSLLLIQRGSSSSKFLLNMQ